MGITATRAACIKEAKEKIEELQRQEVELMEEFKPLQFGDPKRREVFGKINFVRASIAFQKEAINRLENGGSYLGDMAGSVQFNEYSTYRNY